jgi:hypothetical protein
MPNDVNEAAGALDPSVPVAKTPAEPRVFSMVADNCPTV